MQKVVIVNLNGIAYHLEEDAYAALRDYIAAAETQLRGNPDRTEIVGDLEQAIAEKFVRFLSINKNVITGADMTTILGEMGPVHDDGVVATGAFGTLSALRLDHPVETFGYRLVEPDGRRMLPERLAARRDHGRCPAHLDHAWLPGREHVVDHDARPAGALHVAGFLGLAHPHAAHVDRVVLGVVPKRRRHHVRLPVRADGRDPAQSLLSEILEFLAGEHAHAALTG